MQVLFYRPDALVVFDGGRADAVVTNRPMGVGVDRVRPNSSLTVGGRVDSRSITLYDSSSCGGATYATFEKSGDDDSLLVSSKGLTFDAETVDAGRASLFARDLSASGSVVCSDVVAGTFLKPVGRATLPVDPRRRFETLYDYDVGETIACFSISEKDCPEDVDVVIISNQKFNFRRGDVWTADIACAGSLDPSASLDVVFCRLLLSSKDDKSSTIDVHVISVGDDDDSELMIESCDELVQFIGRVVSIFSSEGNEARRQPRNAFLLESYVVGSMETAALRLRRLAGERLESTPRLIRLLPLDCGVPVDFRENLEDVAFSIDPSTYVSGGKMTFRPGGGPKSFFFAALPPGVADTNGSSCVESVEIKDVVVRPVGGPVRSGNRVEMSFEDISAVGGMVATSRKVASRIVLRGWPIEVARVRQVGLHGAEVDVNAMSSMGTLRRLRSFFADSDSDPAKTLFVQGRPWRLAALKDVDRYTTVLSLKRLAPAPGSGDVLDLHPTSVACVLPVRVGASKSLRLDVVRAGVVAVGANEENEAVLRNDRGSLLIEESLSLSRHDDYARFHKNLHVQGDLVAETISHVSDRAFKTDIVHRDPAKDVAILRELEIHEYAFFDRDGPIKEFGVIADELERVLPEAVSVVEGFVPNVRAEATYRSSGFLVIVGRFEAVISKSPRLQVRRRGSDRTTWRDVRVALCYEDSTSTYVGLDDDYDKAGDRLEAGSYEVYGTWGEYKVASTTHLLMCCINAVKGLIGAPPPL